MSSWNANHHCMWIPSFHEQIIWKPQQQATWQLIGGVGVAILEVAVNILLLKFLLLFLHDSLC